MTKYRLSIKGALLFWLLSALLVLSTIFILATYAVDRISLRNKYNDRLKQIALSIPSQLKTSDLRQINVKLFHGRDDFVLQIWDRSSRLVYQSHTDITLPQYSTAGFSIVEWNGVRWKLYVRDTDTHTIQVAQSLDARKEIAEEHAWHTVIPLLLFLPVMAFCIPLCVNRGLHALDRLSRDLRSRDSSTLGPVSTHAQPAEIVPLTQALDTLLLRLGDALDMQRKFIADASHELRTPLATLQIQTQLVEQALGTGQEHSALADLKSGIQRTSHLIEQLLMTSRLESDKANEPHQLLRLDELAREVTIELLPFAHAKQIDLGMERMDAGAIAGSEYQVRLMLRNLIDNAIRYTPASGRVDVEILSDADKIQVRVEDSGPGIPPADRDRVFDRFFRCLGHETPGSGLGLAIVKQVVFQHEAEIRLDLSRRLGGLNVTVGFRRMPAA
jgi:two-component system OmpR family sensor kinase